MQIKGGPLPPAPTKEGGSGVVGEMHQGVRERNRGDEWVSLCGHIVERIKPMTDVWPNGNRHTLHLDLT